MAKKRREDDLDTTTSFADMNVEGFRWYDPQLKKEGKKKREKIKVSRKEYWAMVRGAFAALAPFILILLAVLGIMVLIAFLWLS